MSRLLFVSDNPEAYAAITTALQDAIPDLQITRVAAARGWATRMEEFDLVLVDGEAGYESPAERRLAHQGYLLENVHEAIIAADARFRITMWNPAAEKLYGWTANEVLGRDARRVLPTLNEAERAGALHTLTKTGKLRLEQRRHHKDGRAIYVEETTYLLRDEAGNIVGYVSVNRDITERKAAEAAMRRHSVRMEALAGLSQALAEATPDRQTVLDTVVRRTTAVVGDACLLALFTDEAPGFAPLAYHHPDPDVRDLIGRLLATPAHLEGSDLFRHTVETEQSLLIPTLTQAQARQKLAARYWPYIDQVGVYSVLVVPVRSRGQMIGILVVTRDTPGRAYTEEDRQFLLSLADSAGLSILNARLFEAERQRRQELRALSTRLAALEETQRQQLSRELHDQIGQYLTALSINVNTIRALIDTGADTARVAARLDDSEALVAQMMARVRNIMAELRPAVLDDYGLAAALRWYGNQFAERTGMATIVHAQSLAPRLAPDTETTLFRITQEALTNVARHAQAGTVTIHLESTDATVQLTISDDGRGFEPPGPTPAGDRGWGVFIMRERVEAGGGTLQIDTAPGTGTRLTVEVPR